jgi:hypothetical protein
MAFTCLKTTASDALMTWTTGHAQRYGHGGGVQYFVFEASKYLTLLERQSHVR